MTRYAAVLAAAYPEMVLAIEAGQATGSGPTLDTIMDAGETARVVGALRAVVEDTRDDLQAVALESGEVPAGEMWVLAAAMHALLLGVWLGQRGLASIPEGAATNFRHDGETDEGARRP